MIGVRKFACDEVDLETFVTSELISVNWHIPQKARFLLRMDSMPETRLIKTLL